MRSGACLTVLLASLAASACQQASSASGPSIDFVRGCWVQKDAPGGAIEAFLRLLPGGADGDQTNYSGEIMDVTSGEPGHRQGLSFARDGSAASWWILFGGYGADPDATAVAGGAHDSFERTYDSAFDSGRHQDHAIFESIYVPGGTLAVEATAEQLKVTRNVAETIFDGERDGCD